MQILSEIHTYVFMYMMYVKQFVIIAKNTLLNNILIDKLHIFKCSMIKHFTHTHRKIKQEEENYTQYNA